MNALQAVLLGIVEGITEFLPISSTFHLIFVSQFLSLVQNDFVKLFQVFVQAGATIAVLFLYGREILLDRSLLKKIAISFIPTAFIGFVLYRVVKDVFFESDSLMITSFIFVGFIFLFTEWFVKKKKVKLDKTIGKMTTKEAFLIGCVQALAIVPGVSRAGCVIVGLIFMRFKREESAKYSFILSVPTILAASFYDLFKMRSQIINHGASAFYLLIGSVAAFVSAYIVIRWFIGYLKTNSLVIFAIYRFILAIILIGFGR